jgi:hypothetical protein
MPCYIEQSTGWALAAAVQWANIAMALASFLNGS